jgi:hypothetical protein
MSRSKRANKLFDPAEHPLHLTGLPGRVFSGFCPLGWLFVGEVVVPQPPGK